jgi:hypothetical protein
MSALLTFSIFALALEVLLGLGAHRLGGMVGPDAPWWAWTIMLAITWRTAALLNDISARNA